MKKIILTLTIVSFFGCNEKKDATIVDSENAVETEEIEADTVSESTSDFDRNCVLNNIENFENILSIEELMELTGENSENLSTDYYDGGMNQKFYTYSWADEYAREAKIVKRMIPIDKKIVIVAIDIEQPLNEFKTGYIPIENRRIILSEEEVKAALAGESDNEQLNKTVETLREAGMSDDYILDTIVTKPDADHYTDHTKVVEGYGNVAVWDDITHEFRIHADDLNFVITVDLHEDGEQDLAIAKKIAEFIFEKCKE